MIEYIIGSKLLASLVPKITDRVINLLRDVTDECKQALRDDI